MGGLALVPSRLRTRDDWRGGHPDTAVLLPPPASGTIVDRPPRNDAVDPHQGDEESSGVGIGYSDVEDERLPPKTDVVGVTAGETAKVYPLPAVAEPGVLNDRVGDRPVRQSMGPTRAGGLPRPTSGRPCSGSPGSSATPTPRCTGRDPGR